MRLFLISIGTLAIALLIGLVLRLWGLSLPYKKFEHPFLSSATITTQKPVMIPVFSKSNFELDTDKTGEIPLYKLLRNKTDVTPKITWINLYITADKQIITDYDFDTEAFSKWGRENKKSKGKFIHSYTLAELKEFNPKILLASDALLSFYDFQFVFNILSNDLDVHKEIVSFIENNKLGDRVLITSPIDIVIKAIKEQKPMWIYGTSISEASRLKSFSTLHMEPAISIRGDVFVAPIYYMKRVLLDEKIVTEMRRRKRHVFIGPVTSEEEKSKAHELSPDAIVF
jgi:hypothetical protein